MDQMCGWTEVKSSVICFVAHNFMEYSERADQ